MREFTPEARCVLVRTFAASTAVAFWLGATLGPEWVVPMFGAFSLLFAALLCWIRVGIG